MPKFFVDGSTGDVSFYEDTGTTAELFWDASAEALGLGTTTPAVKLDIDGTDAIRLPVGTDAQRPTGAAGQIRFNSDSDEFEGYDGTAWGALGGGGKVLQVVQTVKTDTFSTSSTSFVDVTGLSVSITPTAATNKILVLMDVKLGSSVNVSNSVKLVRNSTDIYIGDAVGSRIRATASMADDPSNQWAYQGVGIYLDSPNTTSATTYKVQMLSEPSGNLGTVYLNRSGEDSDDNQNSRLASSITVMEIAA